MADLKDYCHLGQSKNNEIYRPKLRKIFRDEEKKIQKYEFKVNTDTNSNSQQTTKSHTEKVIFILGAKGEGKSTVIDALFNHIVGVQYEDSHRLKLTFGGIDIEGEAQLSNDYVSAYTVHQQKESLWMPYSLALVDTPGFGNGTDKDQAIAKQIASFVEKSEVTTIDGLCLVVKSSSQRDTADPKNVINTIFSIFGKEMEDNTFVFATCSEGNKSPFLDVLEKEGIFFNSEHRCNNINLLGLDEKGVLDKFFWEFSKQQFKLFLNGLETTHPCTLKLNLEKELSQREIFVQSKCVSVKEEQGIQVYRPLLHSIYENNSQTIRKFSMGTENSASPERVILVVGGTGSGKSTMIDGMFNYILGVEWKDNYRFKLIKEKPKTQAYSVTSCITSYTIHHQPWFNVPYTLTIVDTPGFGDTDGIQKDKELVKQLREFLSSKGNVGIDRLDVVGFVLQSPSFRLDATHKYIFDSVLQIFGKDIRDNIFMLLTFADAQRAQVLDALEKADIPYKCAFKFNNSALYASNDTTTDSDIIDEAFWEMGNNSFESFISNVNKVHGKSLSLTKEVLSERYQLENSIESFYGKIKLGLGKLDTLAKEIEVIKDNETDINRNKNFTYTVKQHKVVEEATPPGLYTTNCMKCNETCHNDCAYNDDEDKKYCVAMDRSTAIDIRQCTICPQKCVWNLHRNLPYVYVVTVEKVTKTDEDLRRKYQEASRKKLSAEQLAEKTVQEFQVLQKQVLASVERSRKSIERLAEIALKPHSLSIVDYIDLLVGGEEREKKPGWRQRTEQLYCLKEKAHYEHGLVQGNFDPYQKEIDKQKVEDKDGIWTTVEKKIGRLFRLGSGGNKK